LIGAAQPGSREQAAEYAALRGHVLRDVGNNCISPGLIDVHAHISAIGDRGFEGYASASEAAAAGGITTIVQMPLNSVPVSISIYVCMYACM
jgi:allantoinase